QGHWKAQFDAVPVLPGPAQNKIAAGICESRHRTSVHLYAAAFRPVRNAQSQININRSCRRDRHSGSLLFGERRLLRKAETLLRPVHIRRYIYVDEYGIVIVEIDGDRQL